MRILLAQINTVVGDVDGNMRRAVEVLAEGRRRGVDLVVFPEQTLPGYPPRDLLLYGNFLARCQKALQHFAECTANGPAAIIGFPEVHFGIGHGLFNSAAFCRDGHIEKVYRKWLLPTYDVFDEDRYFDESREVAIVEVAGKRVGITICEDIWNDELYWRHRRYDVDPVRSAVEAGAEVVVNLSASPFAAGKREMRREMLARVALRHRVPLVLVNLVGANDDVIFDGSSLAVSASGMVVAEAAAFAEDLVEFDTAATDPAAALTPLETIEQIHRALVLGIRDYFRKSGFKKALIGLSGGIDSALVAALAAEALGPENVQGVSMPSRYSSDHSRTDAEVLARNLGIGYSTVAIESMFATASKELAPHLPAGCEKMALENMQARLRGIILMSISNATGALVLTTGNKSEVATGYCTLYGDMCGSLAVIADLLKTRVYDLSHHLNRLAGRAVIPESTLTKEPSAELAPGQKDSDSLPPYDLLDAILKLHLEDSLGPEELIARGYEDATVKRVVRLVQLSEYKRRQAAPVLKVTGRAFGHGWRMPIARK